MNAQTLEALHQAVLSLSQEANSSVAINRAFESLQKLDQKDFPTQLKEDFNKLIEIFNEGAENAAERGQTSLNVSEPLAQELRQSITKLYQDSKALEPAHIDGGTF